MSKAMEPVIVSSRTTLNRSTTRSRSESNADKTSLGTLDPFAFTHRLSLTACMISLVRRAMSALIHQDAGEHRSRTTATWHDDGQSSSGGSSSGASSSGAGSGGGGVGVGSGGGGTAPGGVASAADAGASVGGGVSPIAQTSDLRTSTRDTG